MRLKSLEIKGFKSFADKTIVNLDNQITGIVGPNGCGKSNIVDAIRWVIGEHKIKTLRSDNLQDLIFNGSKTRNGSGLAEVALTFENTKNLLPTDFNTVTISRKFYRNGESEYRLNDVTCRLKDITNLFLDTGVTSDSYSIIELSMVDDIIKDKDNSRRRMLEQAAGISIYKTRKKEAKLKLDATELDLNRIEDLLFEISNNLRTLESQAKKAEKYHQIKGAYKEVSVEFVKASLSDFNDTYQNLSAQQQQEVDSILAIDAELSKEGVELEEQKLLLIKKEEELHEFQKSFNELMNQLRSLENDKNLTAQKELHLKEIVSNTEGSIAELQTQKVNLEKATLEADKKISTEEDTLSKLKSKVEELRSNLDAKRLIYDNQKNELDGIRQQHQQLQVQQFEAEKKVAIAENNISNQQRILHQLDEETKVRTSEIEKLTLDKQQAEEERTNLQTQLTELISKQEEATQKLLSSQAQLEELRVALFEENRKLDAKQNEYNLLKSLIDSLEGYPDSIKFLNKNNAWPHEAKLLSEVFTVQEDFRICIETYLDKYLNYYVVDTPEQAYQAISLLKEHKKGKAGFFILSELSAHNKETPNKAAGIAALDTINTDTKYQPLLNHLLQNVYITEADHAEGIQDNLILLSKDGTQFKSDIHVVGGSVGVFEGNKIGRTKRLEKLSEEIAVLHDKTQTIKKSISLTQEQIVGFNQEIKDTQINQTKEALNRTENTLVQIEHKIDNYKAQNEQTKTRMQELHEQLESSKLSVKDILESHQKMQSQLTLSFDNLQQGQEKFSIAEKEYNRATEDYNQQTIIVARQQSRINEINNEKAIRAQQIEETVNKLAELENRLKETSKDIDETLQTLKGLEESLYQSLQQKEQNEKQLNEADQAYYNFRNQINEKESLYNKKRREKEQKEANLTGIKDKLTEMKLQMASMKERLHVEFKIDLDEVLKQPRVGEQSLEELQAEVDRLKKRLENLGDVNPMAVEAYKEMKSRFEFIEEQKSDLVKAKENLLKTIEEVESTANQKFLETFEKVKNNFKEVFHALFTEDDTCDLKLLDPDNPAETPIEIYAQPKGKKPSTITQLSGGEKTLTSAAFLFAIYLIKPAPFCVLDEVDAPLDDANVGKFTNMIRKFSDNSQFIIVTHNKLTMASVDVIYGVTMQEAGVSKLVPVDFRSLN